MNKKSDINIVELSNKGLQALADKHAEAEVAKLGSLRGGNSGCLTEDGRILGKCPRLSHLRSLGYQKAVELKKQLMFQAGLTNEDSWLNTLTEAWDGVILTETDVPTKWFTTNETPVTGRPDIVLCDENSNPQLGIELKLVCSPFTAYNVLAKHMPALDHLIQAGHYMWQLGIPFKVVYTSRSNYSLGFGSMKKKWDQVLAWFFNASGTSVEPFVIEFDIWFEDGVLMYQTGDDEPYQTDITAEGIEKYYECTSMIAESGSLGPRPEEKNVLGGKLSYGCKTCYLQEICDTYEHDYELWIDHVKKELT